MTDSNGVVLYEVQEGIAQVTLNRPDALNAWVPELGRAYFDRLEEADSNPDVRVIVVTAKDLTDDDRERLARSAERVILKQAMPLEELRYELRGLLAARRGTNGVD